MATVSASVLGLRELGEKMRQLERKVALKVSRAATNAGAQKIKRRIKAKYASTPSVDTGLVQKNVVVKRNSRTNLTSEHLVSVRPVPYPNAGAKGEFRHTSNVARFLEFGTVKMAAEPAFRPAFDEGKEDALDAMVKTLDAGITKAVGG